MGIKDSSPLEVDGAMMRKLAYLIRKWIGGVELPLMSNP